MAMPDPNMAAAGGAPMTDDPSAQPEQKGYCIEINVDAQGQITVGVEDAGQEAAEESGAPGGDEGGGMDADKEARPCPSIKAALTLALEIYRSNGEMPGSADDDFQDGFGSQGAAS